MYQYDIVLRYAGSEPTSMLNWLVAPSEADMMVAAIVLSLGGAGSILDLGHQ